MVIAARGTSDNAARYAQYLLGLESRLSVGLATPWLFRHRAKAPRLAGAAVIGISQSGRSPDIVAVLAAARAQERPTIAITNAPDSPLAAEADAAVALLAGDERSVAATKTYTASLHSLVQIQQALRPEAGRRSWLERLPALVTEAAIDALEDRARCDALAGARPITVTGRGLCFAAACESALKLRELTGTPAEAFSPPDLLHGPIAAVDERAGVWVIPAGAEDDERAALAELLTRGGPTVVVGDDDRLLAERLGVDVDSPHGLRKVTLTR